MPNYSYKAKDLKGKIQSGDINAPTLTDFYARLKEKGLYCIAYKEDAVRKNSIKTIYKMKTTELIMFTRKLGTMLNSGMGMNSAFDVLYSTADHKKMKELYVFVYESIQKGMPLSESMKSAGRSFPQLLINMIESGEISGNIDVILNKMAVYFEKQHKLMQKVRAATMYPIILCVVCVGVIIILFTFVLPKLFDLFSDQELPPLTQGVMNISNFLTSYYVWVILGLIILFIVIKMLFTIPAVKLAWDKLKINAPLFGKLNKKIYSSQFASAISMLYSSGIPLLNAVKLASNVIQNSYVKKSFVDVAQNISKGESLSSSIENIQVFDKMLPSMVKIGEETGSLDTILVSTAEYFDLEAENAIAKILALLEPILLCTMAVIVGLILVSVIEAIYSSYSNIS